MTSTGTAAQNADHFARERALAVNRTVYAWDRLPGLPAFCKGLPELEKPPRLQSERFLNDIANSVFEAVTAKRSFAKALKSKDQLDAYSHLRPRGPLPSVTDRWQQDAEFARQRLNGVNPIQIRRLDSMPAHLAVTDERVRSVLAEGETLDQLMGDGRLFLCDWPGLVDTPVTLGRFLTAPSALFFTDSTGTLMPLAIQLDRTATYRPEFDREDPPVVFTPADERWLWLTARAHVQSADAAWHECVVHLFRTHLIMETFWVAANRGLSPQHPIHRLLTPHFDGTISINHKARTELIVPGGPIDDAISVGTDGAYWLISQALDSFDFSDLDPIADLVNRQVDDRVALANYHYRDDATVIWHAISDFTEELLRCFYPDDQAVIDDVELQEWARELTDPACGGIVGLPVTDGRFDSLADLHTVIRQIVFTVSAEHSAVNNGQYDIFGCIPNSPGAIYLPHPTTLAPSSEGEFTYGLPPFKAAEVQIMLVHLLSQPTLTHLGDYPPEYFQGITPARICIDRFRKRLDGIMTDIRDRNDTLAVPYTYLDPAFVAASIDV